MDSMKKIQLIKDLLKEIHSSVDPVKLRERFKEILQRVSPFEIPLIKQELIKEDISIN
ncbi:MAG: DUF438 domain-containing protein [Desulfurococcaceae archaeon]